LEKYIQLLKNHLGVAFDSRVNILTNLLQEFIALSSIIILWFAIFSSNNNIAGYTQNTIMFYYLLVPFVGFITRVFIVNDLSEDIKNGVLSNKLLKPYSVSLDALMSSIAGQLNFFIFIFPIYIILFIVLVNNSHVQITSGGVIVGFIFALLAYFLSFTMDLSIAWLAFWIDDVWAFRHVKNIIFGIFGGLNFPLDFVSQNIRWIFDFLPFKYLFYIPVSYMNGTRGSEYILNDLIGLALWATLFIILGNVLWKNGIKRYGAYGN